MWRLTDNLDSDLPHTWNLNFPHFLGTVPRQQYKGPPEVGQDGLLFKQRNGGGEFKVCQVGLKTRESKELFVYLSNAVAQINEAYSSNKRKH